MAQNNPNETVNGYVFSFQTFVQDNFAAAKDQAAVYRRILVFWDALWNHRRQGNQLSEEKRYGIHYEQYLNLVNEFKQDVKKNAFGIEAGTTGFALWIRPRLKFVRHWTFERDFKKLRTIFTSFAGLSREMSRQDFHVLYTNMEVLYYDAKNAAEGNVAGISGGGPATGGGAAVARIVGGN